MCTVKYGKAGAKDLRWGWNTRKAALQAAWQGQNSASCVMPASLPASICQRKDWAQDRLTDQVPSVPIWSCKVTCEDLLRLQGLYDVLHLNFVHSISQQLMEQLAGGLVKADAAQRIAKVHDMYMSFSTLEAGLFCLNLPEAYRHINAPSASEAQIEVGVACHSSVCHGLRSISLVGYWSGGGLLILHAWIAHGPQSRAVHQQYTANLIWFGAASNQTLRSCICSEPALASPLVLKALPCL